MKTDVSEFLEREILVMPKRTTNIQKFKKQMGTSFAVGRCSANTQNIIVELSGSLHMNLCVRYANNFMAHTQKFWKEILVPMSYLISH